MCVCVCVCVCVCGPVEGYSSLNSFTIGMKGRCSTAHMVCTHQEVERIKCTKEKLTAFIFGPACIPCVGISVCCSPLTHQYYITDSGHFIIVSHTISLSLSVLHCFTNHIHATNISTLQCSAEVTTACKSLHIHKICRVENLDF